MKYSYISAGWSNIVDNAALSLFLFLSLCLCFWVILATQLFQCLLIETEWNTDTCSKINNISANLCYSFLAGYLFYVLTSWLPTIIRQVRIRPVIEQGYNDIKVMLHNMYSSFHDSGECRINMNDLQFIKNNMMSFDWAAPCIPPLKGKRYIENLAYSAKELDDKIFDFISLYKEELDTAELIALEKIRQKIPVCLYESLKGCVINKDNCGVLVDEFIELLKEAQQFFGNLNTEAS